MRVHVRRLLLPAAAALALAAPPAHAAFPGANGALVFASTATGESDVYAVAPDGSGLRNITSTPGREQQPAVSPDGTRIAYKTVTAGPRDEESWVSGFDGTGARQLTDTPGALRFSTQPGWTADGARLLVRSNRDGGSYDVWSVRASDGGDPVQLTRDAADDRYPAVSPDGTRVVFRSDRSGDPDIWVVGADGSNPVDLTPGTGRWESAPAWSPDGRRIAFERVGLPGDPDVDPAVAVTDEIWTMAADGSDQRRLTDNAAHDEGPAWSPDGTQIAFTSARAEPKGDIWAMAADGSGHHLVFGTPATEESPDWQPIPVAEPMPVPKPFTAGLVTSKVVSRRGLTATGLRVQLSCRTACTYRVELRAGSATARRLGLTRKRTGTVALGVAKGTATGKRTTVLTLTAKARAALRRLGPKRSVALSVALDARPATGAPVTRVRGLTVKT